MGNLCPSRRKNQPLIDNQDAGIEILGNESFANTVTHNNDVFNQY